MGRRAFKRDVRKRKAKDRVKDVVLLGVAALTAAFVLHVLDQPGEAAVPSAVAGVAASVPSSPTSRLSGRAAAAPSPRVAALAATDRTTAIRYAGDGGCDARPAAVERTVDGGRTWRPVRTRVAHPTGVSAAGPYVVLAGRDARCAWVTDISVDRGATMTASKVVLQSTVVGAGGRVWAVDHQGRLLRGGAGLPTAERLEVPCASKSTPAYVAARGRRVWVVCRGGRTASGGEVRLVVASRDDGATWAPVAGSAGPAAARKDGLDGTGSLDGFGFSDESHGWALLRGTGRCAGNDADLRVTGDAGRTWTALPCVPPKLAEKVRSVSFGEPLHAMLITDSPDGLATVVTTDGGATWRATAR